jgi:hypothetical protein
MNSLNLSSTRPNRDGDELDSRYDMSVGLYIKYLNTVDISEEDSLQIDVGVRCLHGYLISVINEDGAACKEIYKAINLHGTIQSRINWKDLWGNE